MSCIEDRLFSGGATPADSQWLDFLAEVFDGISIPEFASAGMDLERAKRLLAVVALARRVRAAYEDLKVPDGVTSTDPAVTTSTR